MSRNLMSSRRHGPLSFQAARDLWTMNSRQVSRNGYLKLRYAETLHFHTGYDDYFVVRRHGHPVVEIHSDGSYRLDSCGFRTTTTKKTLNSYGPAQVFQKGGQWFVATTDPYAPPAQSGLKAVEFRDGMLVNDLGVVYVESSCWEAVQKTF